MKAAPRKWLRRGLSGLAALVVALVAFVVIDGWKAFGRRADGERRARMERSPQWHNGRFVNPQPLENDMLGALWDAFDTSPHTRPDEPLPAVAIDPKRFESPPASGLRVTWLGHSCVLVEIDGHRVLIDPVWSDRPSPLPWAGPTRWNPPLIALRGVPVLDAVLISHDHYDHLDYATILAMKDWPTKFVVPLGVGAHLAYWGVPEERIVELDWWERTQVRDLVIVGTPARHASGRTGMIGEDGTLWSGFALLGSAHRAWYSGDTGLFPGLNDIGERLGPFDLTMIEVGAYGRRWPDWHLGPEQALRAHAMVRGRVMLPTHWGLFTLAYHGWTEPIERTLAAATAAGATVIAPRPGESVEPSTPPPFDRWWPALPWKTGTEEPIVATGME